MPAETFIEATEVGYAKLEKARHLLTGLDIHLSLSECHVSISPFNHHHPGLLFRKHFPNSSDSRVPSHAGHTASCFLSESNLLISLILPTVWTDPINQKQNSKTIENKKKICSELRT